MIYQKFSSKKVDLIIKNKMNIELIAQHLTFRHLNYIKKLKNKNRNNFTYKKKVTWLQHIKWYIKYLRDSDNFFTFLKVKKLITGQLESK